MPDATTSRVSATGGVARTARSILAAVLGIHEMVVLVMILVAGVGALFERFAPPAADSEAAEQETDTPE
jgi:hypothetical protein